MSNLHFSPRPNKAANIHWNAWGEAPFVQAKAEDKPVLLAISAVWCHWCHVMDETSYSNDAVIDLINERFVPVRVDNDQRPDVNQRYNMGGWPTTAFLTPDGEVLYGGTYIPPDAMVEALRKVDHFYADPANRIAATKRSAELRAARAARARAPQGGDLDPLTAETVLAALGEAFDDEHGGFGLDQKFPHVDALAFLLDLCAREPNERARQIVHKTLRAMSDRGMYDHVEGGFFRYSTTPDFSVPHFEKMLQDQSGLMLACARAGVLFEDSMLCATAIDVKHYLDKCLWIDSESGYGGSQDADESYYALSAAERAKVKPPYVDPTIYTSWNAQAAGSMLLAAALLERRVPDGMVWHRRGVRTLEMLWNQMLHNGLMCRYAADREAHIRGLLDDQIWSIWAALVAFAVTAEEPWLERAGDLVDHTDELFDASAGVYLDRRNEGGEPGRVAEPVVSLEENARMACVLMRYAAASGRNQWAERARAILQRYARDYQSHQIFAAGYGQAVLDALQPPLHVYVVAPANDLSAMDLRAAALSVARPRLDVIPLDPKQDGERAAALGYDASEVTALVCSADTCFARATSTDQLLSALAAAAPSLSVANAAHKE